MVTTSLAREVPAGQEEIEVHVINSNRGNYVTYWTIPDDISAEDARKWADPETGILRVTTIFEAGETETYLALGGAEPDIDTFVFG
ncbi:MAG: hypothetical protein GWN47_04140 [Woeseiaceae bacterium]|nr:hypothetical protein [Woeseiaceae bacterium]